MKLKCITLFIFIAFFNSLNAQSLRYPIAMPYIGLTAYSNQQTNSLSFIGNQAALAQAKQVGIGIYSEKRFMLSQTMAYTLGLAIPTKLGNIGIQMNYAGFTNFNEQKFGLAYAKSISRIIDVGIQFNYYGYKIPAYSSASTINVEAGAIVHLSEKLNAGIHIYNPIAGKLNKNTEEKLASAYKLGLGYDVSNNFLLSAEVVKETDKPVNVIAGFQYHFAKQFFAKAGFLTESNSYYAGAGVGWAGLRLDVGTSYHPQLGFSPALLIIYNFKKTPKETSTIKDD